MNISYLDWMSKILIGEKKEVRQDYYPKKDEVKMYILPRLGYLCFPMWEISLYGFLICAVKNLGLCRISWASEHLGKVF